MKKQARRFFTRMSIDISMMIWYYSVYTLQILQRDWYNFNDLDCSKEHGLKEGTE